MKKQLWIFIGIIAPLVAMNDIPTIELAYEVTKSYTGFGETRARRLEAELYDNSYLICLKYKKSKEKKSYQYFPGTSPLRWRELPSYIYDHLDWHYSDIKECQNNIFFLDTCLHLALCQGGTIQQIRKFLGLGARIDGDRPVNPFSVPLHEAIGNDREDALKKLLKYGANPDTRYYGNTPLHCAVNCAVYAKMFNVPFAFDKRITMIKRLVAYKANRQAKNNSEETPLDIAKRHAKHYNVSEIITILEGV